MSITKKRVKAKRVTFRVRKKIKLISSRLRLSVFRSNKHIYAQIIDDSKGITLASASDQKISSKEAPIKIAYLVGQLIAEKALNKKIKKVVFDRGCYRYHGRVKAVADGARAGGLIF